MSAGYDSSSTGSKTPGPNQQADLSSYFASISPSSKSTGLNIPTRSSPRSDHLGSARERRSSFSLGLDSIRHAGGPNSIDAFARSWTRAAGYFEITSARSYISVSTRDEEQEGSEYAVSESACYDDDDMTPSVHPHLSFHGNYGTISSGLPTERLDDSIVRHAADLFVEQQHAAEQPIDKEREPLLVKTVERDDGVVEQVIVGQSTLPQTIFNSVNTLIGIGLLSVPLGMKYSGWALGMPFLLFSALATNYTAKLLARCLDKSPNQALVTYSDIAYIAFGQKSRILVSILFSLELVAANVALVVLFADSLNDLIPSLSVTEWKVVAFFVLTPSNFLPLRVLSFSSILGIFSTFSIFVIVVINGLLKPDAPGSLREPMDTYLFPQSWMALPLSFGLLMSPWSGHSVFPNIYKDMRHPYKYNKGVDITYTFTYLLDAGMGVVGLLMFGDGVRDELTSNIIATIGYPEALQVAMVVFIAIIPLTKTPLNARPIVSTLEILLGVHARALATPTSLVGMSGFKRGLIQFMIRVIVSMIFTILAILVPGFDSIMSFLGSALCFAICIVLPLMFYLKIFGDEVSYREKVFAWVLIVISSIMALVGTVFTFLPKESLGVVI